MSSSRNSTATTKIRTSGNRLYKIIIILFSKKVQFLLKIIISWISNLFRFSNISSLKFVNVKIIKLRNITVLLRHDGYVQDQEVQCYTFQGPNADFCPAHRKRHLPLLTMVTFKRSDRAPPVTAASTFHFQWSTNTIPFRIIFRIVHGSKHFSRISLSPPLSTLEISNITKYYHN